MSTNTKPSIRFYERWTIQILRSGQIPHHMAFIMDGNRRYAAQRGIKKQAGHQQGLESMKRCLEWCLHLGVCEVTVFAFGIENFSREKEEVDVLMTMARENLHKMAQEGDFLQQHCIRVNICGDLGRCPPEVQRAMQEVEQLTAENNQLRLNICFSYNSTFEINNAVQKLDERIARGELARQEVTLDELRKHLLIPSFPDVIVRTSNEIRLSDFMTLQAVNSQLHFLKENWPEMSILSLVHIILSYQINIKRMKNQQRNN